MKIIRTCSHQPWNKGKLIGRESPRFESTADGLLGMAFNRESSHSSRVRISWLCGLIARDIGEPQTSPS